MEDLTHMQFFSDVERELTAVIVDYNRKASGVTDKAKLIALRTEQADLLIELLKKHRRAMDFMQGKPVEPVMHFGEAVLLPVGGLG
jgi:hypothetical protein